MSAAGSFGGLRRGDHGRAPGKVVLAGSEGREGEQSQVLSGGVRDKGMPWRHALRPGMQEVRAAVLPPETVRTTLPGARTWDAR